MLPPPLPPEVFDALPAAVQVYIRLIESIAGRVETLSARVAELEARLNQNSSNSSKPPSSDPPSVKPAPAKPPSGKRRGGQPGHPKHERTILPPDEVHEHRPTHCSACHSPLRGDDPEPVIEQVIELPVKLRHVVHHRRHTLTCSCCGTATAAPTPTVPEAEPGFGPRLQAMVAYLSGVGRMGKRPIRQFCEDLLGVPLSPGSVSRREARTSQALEPLHAEAKEAIRAQDANVDQTGGKQGGKKAWLWVAVTGALSVFLIHRNRSREAFAALMGPQRGVLTTDRYSVYDHLPIDRRQVCWAHLRRDFQAMIDRNNAGRRIGEELLEHAEILFSHWRRVRDGTLSRRGFRTHYLSWLRPEVASLLRSGAACECAKTATVCRDLLALEESLWTFARVEGVEPTNNAAERAVRHAVCWRKTSYRTDSERGSRFVERILTVGASCRQQGRNILQFLTEAIHSQRHGTTKPSLLPNAA
jgi:transposase